MGAAPTREQKSWVSRDTLKPTCDAISFREMLRWMLAPMNMMAFLYVTVARRFSGGGKLGVVVDEEAED